MGSKRTTGGGEAKDAFLPELRLHTDPNWKWEGDFMARILDEQKGTWQYRDLTGAYPDLAAKSEKEGRHNPGLIRAFFDELAQANREALEAYFNQAREMVAQGSTEMFRQLGDLMDYRWRGPTVIEAIPTFLPFGPFGDNVFFYMLYFVVKGKAKPAILSYAAHEVSHMILLRQLREVHPNLVGQGNIFKTGDWDITVEYLKEIVAPVIMNQEPLKKVIALEAVYPNGYVGNDNLWFVYVQSKVVERPERVTNYFLRLFNSRRAEGKGFPEIIGEMLACLGPHRDELIQKQKLWGQYGMEILKDKSVYQEYAAAMKVRAI